MRAQRLSHRLLRRGRVKTGPCTADSIRLPIPSVTRIYEYLFIYDFIVLQDEPCDERPFPPEEKEANNFTGVG